MKILKKKVLFSILFGFLFHFDVLSQVIEENKNESDLIEGMESEESLVQAAQNSVGDLISLPFQNNTNFEMGSYDRTQNVLNIQPVIPISLGEDWKVSSENHWIVLFGGGGSKIF